MGMQKVKAMTTQDRIRAAGGVIHKDGNIFFKNVEQFLAACQVPEGMKLVPVEVLNLYNFMASCFVPMTSQQEQIALSLVLANNTLLAVAPDADPPANQKVPLTDEQIDKCVEVVWGSYAEFDEVRLFTRQIEAAHNITPATGTKEKS